MSRVPRCLVRSAEAVAGVAAAVSAAMQPVQGGPAGAPAAHHQARCRHCSRARRRHSLNMETGMHQVFWHVDASKLKGQERQTVSPSFELPFEGRG